MPYGSIKVDNIIFTDGGSDQTTTVSGVYRAITSGVTVSGTISGLVVNGATVSGTTVNGVTISGTTVTGTTAQFTNITGGGIGATTITGVTVTGTTVNGVTISGTTVTGTTAQFTNITGIGIGATTITGVTVTGTTANFTSGNFTALSGASTTVTSGIFAVGSAAAPSISFTSDPNTGIYSPSADQVAISTNGTGRLFVDASGNISNTSSFNPYATSNRGSITVNGVTSSLYALGVNNVAAGYLYADSTGVTVGAPTSKDIVFDINGEKVRITAGGNVGIGTSSPSQKLTVDGNILTTSAAGTDSFINVTTAGVQNTYLGFNNSGSTNSNGVLNNYSYVGNANAYGLQFLANGGVKATLDTIGRLGIGTTSPGVNLDVASATPTVRVNATGGGIPSLSLFSAGVYDWSLQGGTALKFIQDATERARIDSSGRLLVGTFTARDNFFNTTASAGFQLEGTGTNRRAAIIGDDFEGSLILASQKSGSVGGNTVLGSGDPIGAVSFQGSDGTEFVEAATITAFVDGTPGANDMPGRLVFYTTADGAASPTERMRINNAGVIECNKGGVLNTWLQVYNGNSSQDLAFVSSDNAGNEWHFGRKRADGYFYVVRQTGTGMYMDTNSWVATSDQRAKQNIADIESTIDVVKALKPSRFSWRTDGTADVGFIAQQVQTLIPEAVVDSGKPEAMLGITQDKLLPFVVKALQEAIAKIETLEARLTAAGIA
jgi:hypothetical protein